MKAFTYLAAAAVASVVSMAPSLAHATASDDLKNTASGYAAAATNTGNGGAFNTKVFKTAFGYTNAQFNYIFGNTTLSAGDWYDQITTGTVFVEKTNIADIAAGQFFAIDATDSYIGHSGVVLDTPAEITPPIQFYGPVVSGTRQFSLYIADSTSSVHGTNASYPDSRNSSSPANVSKSGYAYIRLYTDSAGAILGYTWSVTSSTTPYFDETTRPIAFGYLAAKPL